MAELAALGAFSEHLRLLPNAGEEISLLVSERGSLGLATMMGRAGQTDALADRVKVLFGIDLPTGPSLRSRSGVGFAGIGPDVWLAMSEDAAPAWAGGLAQDLAGIASISDQSSGYAVLRITGSGTRDLLSHGAFIDFHPSAFGPGSVAVTDIAHIGVIIWQLDDAPTFEVALFRSFAGSFWHWLLATAAGMGIALAGHSGLPSEQRDRPLPV